jgi:hypothetical protein
MACYGNGNMIGGFVWISLTISKQYCPCKIILLFLFMELPTVVPYLRQLDHHMAYGACQLRVHYADFSSVIVTFLVYESAQLWKHHRREQKSLPVIFTPTIQSP